MKGLNFLCHGSVKYGINKPNWNLGESPILGRIRTGTHCGLSMRAGRICTIKTLSSVYYMLANLIESTLRILDFIVALNCNV